MKNVFSILLLSILLSSCSSVKKGNESNVAQYIPPQKIQVLGGDEKSFEPEMTNEKVEDAETYDAVVVGGGLAGLSSTLYMSDQGLKVLLLEKEPNLGGLAFGGTLGSTEIQYDRGAAYWTDAYEEELKILDRVSLADFADKHKIPEPSDSFLWNGKLYLGIWEEETLKELPASFALFKHELEMADKDKLIPNQPMEDFENVKLDTLTAAQWVRSMPASILKRTDPHSKEIYERFKKDPNVNHKDPMKDVLGLLDQFGRSALGSTADKISAMAFANFYISEIVPRYTTPVGTGEASRAFGHILRDRMMDDESVKPENKLVRVKIKSKVVHIENKPEFAVTHYINDGKTHSVKSKYVVFTGQLKFLNKILPDLKKKDKERFKQLEKLEYSHYAVHNLILKGHPYRATYDTWVRMPNTGPNDFTDFILGRWMDKNINAYEGMRDFSKNPKDEYGIITIYHHLNPKLMGKGFSKELASNLAETASNDLKKILNPILAEKWKTQLDVIGIETTRWPYSIHIPKPGHLTKAAKILKRPFGRVFMANNNLGTPAFEEALFRGHCAANNVISRIKKEFKQEPWTNCKIEKDFNP